MSQQLPQFLTPTVMKALQYAVIPAVVSMTSSYAVYRALDHHSSLQQLQYTQLQNDYKALLTKTEENDQKITQLMTAQSESLKASLALLENQKADLLRWRSFDPKDVVRLKSLVLSHENQLRQSVLAQSQAESPRRMKTQPKTAPKVQSSPKRPAKNAKADKKPSAPQQPPIFRGEDGKMWAYNPMTKTFLLLVKVGEEDNIIIKEGKQFFKDPGTDEYLAVEQPDPKTLTPVSGSQHVIRNQSPQSRPTMHSLTRESTDDHTEDTAEDDTEDNPQMDTDAV